MKEKINHIWNSRKIQLFVLGLIAFCLCVFHVGNDMWSWTKRCFVDGELLQISRFVLILVHTYISIMLLLLIAVRSRVVAYVVLPFVLLTWGVPAYLRVSMGHVLYSELITGALETNWKELSGFLDAWTVAAALVLIAGCVCLGYVCRRFLWHLISLPGVWIWSAALGYFVLTTAPIPLLAEKYPKTLIPLLYKVRPCEGKAREDMVKDMLIGMENEYRPEYPYRVLIPFYRQLAFVYYVADYYLVPGFKSAEMYPSKLTCDDDVVVVLFIGESYRAKNASWNGYERETLPQMSTVRCNTINFPFFKSFGTSTISSIYGMISDATCTHREASHTSFLSILDKHDFKNNLVLSRTTRWDFNPRINKLFDDKIDNVVLCNNSDEVASVIEHAAIEGGRQMIVLEDGTGHAPYTCDPRFNRYNGCLMDLYDNSLLQTDDLLFRIVEKLKDRKAVMLYCSDHGQSFGEQGAWMHGGALDIIHQRHVFSFVWYSDAYAAAHSEKIANMRANANKLLSHDDIYLSILSLAGVECEFPTPTCEDFCKPLDRPNIKCFILDEK